jgi:hypothetical protein
MKTALLLFVQTVAWILGMFSAQPLIAVGTNESVERIGIYDSRAIAYAHFWSEDYQRRLNATVNAAKAARATGATNRALALEAVIQMANATNHLQVFSTAPVDGILASLPLTVIQQKANVSRLVSKWDDQTLRQFPRAERIDVTDELLREFRLTDKQKSVIADLCRKQPLPLGKAQKLMREGKL